MTAIFIFSGPSPANYPRIEITQGDNQTGALGGQLEDYLEVKVTDGNRRTISGVAVQFDDDASAGIFRPVPGTDVYVNDLDALVGTLTNSINADTFTATPTLPVAGEDIFVQTDSSGLAKVYYELSDTAGVARIDASLTGTTIDVTFRAEGVEDSRKASLRMVSGDGQSADKGDPLEDPLVVLARSTAGYRIPGVNIRLTTSTGTLSRSVGTALASVSSVSSGNNIVVVTGADGTASVEYNVGQLTVARTVTASIDNEQSVDLEYDFEVDRVTFNINGRASTARPPAAPADDDDAPPPASVRVVVPPTVTGTAGDTATLTVTAPATSSVTVGNALRETQGLDTFPRANASPVTFTGSGTSTLTLPSQTGNYTLTVTVGSTAHRVTVSVTQAAAQTAGRLTVRVEPLTGAPGSTATVTVTAADSSAQPASVAVNLTATGGTLSNSSVTTGFNGSTTVTLTRGSTVGSENFVTVSGPSGYDSVSGRFVIAGPAGRDMTVGAAAEVDVYDGNNQDGLLKLAAGRSARR